MEIVKNIISQLDLTAHPEGGYFKETYRSSGIIKTESLDPRYEGDRNYATCIYFLLTSDNFSAFHRIKQDEIWHFYDGSPIRLHMITETGNYTEQLIGKNIEQGELPQFVVPGGCWFASEVLHEDSYSLTGCTVSPGFSFEDFELKSQKELTYLFPHLEHIITKLTHY